MSMFRLPLVVLLSLAVACAKSGSSEPPPEAAPEATTAARTDAPTTGGPKLLKPITPGTVVGGDPEALYATCKQRVEGPDKAGECTTDADCTKTGCSSEVCASKTDAAGMMTTCEVLPCFAALDTCGCVEGICSWALKEAPPAGQ